MVEYSLLVSGQLTQKEETLNPKNSRFFIGISGLFLSLLFGALACSMSGNTDSIENPSLDSTFKKFSIQGTVTFPLSTGSKSSIKANLPNSFLRAGVNKDQLEVYCNGSFCSDLKIVDPLKNVFSFKGETDENAVYKIEVSKKGSKVALLKGYVETPQEEISLNSKTTAQALNYEQFLSSDPNFRRLGFSSFENIVPVNSPNLVPITAVIENSLENLNLILGSDFFDYKDIQEIKGPINTAVKGVGLTADKLSLVCHKIAGKNPFTMVIIDSALQSHLDHGDVLGVCAVETGIIDEKPFKNGKNISPSNPPSGGPNATSSTTTTNGGNSTQLSGPFSGGNTTTTSTSGSTGLNASTTITTTTSTSTSTTSPSIPDLAPPFILNVSPVGSGNSLTVSAILVTFNEPILPSSISNLSFSVNNGIFGTYSVNGATVTMTLTSGNLAANTTYTVNMSSNIKDLAGNTMGTPFSWSFGTKGIPGVNWGAATQNAGFSPRAGHTSVVFNDGFGPKMWIIEGYGGGLKSDIWKSSDGANWFSATSNANFPVRETHSLVVFNNGSGLKMWVIAGYDGSYRNDIWNSENGIAWTQVTSGAAFSGRNYHSSLIFNDGTGEKIWVIAGRDATTTRKKDVWKSLDGVTWTQKTANAAFSARHGHTSVVFNDDTGSKMWVIGGHDGSYKNDVWKSGDGVIWTQVTSNAGFSPRAFHTSVVFDDGSGPKLWVIAGRPTTDSNDIWKSSDGITWTQVLSSAPFSVRETHSTVVFDRGDGLKMWVIAGHDGVSLVNKNDVWYSP